MATGTFYKENTFTENGYPHTITFGVYGSKFYYSYLKEEDHNYKAVYLNVESGDFVYFENFSGDAYLIMGNCKSQTSTNYKGTSRFSYYHHLTPVELERIAEQGFPENINQYAMICNTTVKELYVDENQFFAADEDEEYKEPSILKEIQTKTKEEIFGNC